MLATESVAAEGSPLRRIWRVNPKEMIPKGNAKGTPLHFP